MNLGFFGRSALKSEQKWFEGSSASLDPDSSEVQIRRTQLTAHARRLAQAAAELSNAQMEHRDKQVRRPANGMTTVRMSKTTISHPG